MKHDAFDEALRRRAQRERLEPPAQADERMARAIREGRARAAAPHSGVKDMTETLNWPDERQRTPPKPRLRAVRLVPLLTGAAACLAAVALWAVRTPVDRVLQTTSDAGPAAQTTGFETVLPLSDGENGTSALAPQGEAHAASERGVWRAETRFFNDTQDIWLVSWAVDTAADMLESPDELIWLEPGASCTDYAAWPVEGEQETPTWQYTAYRVDADVLHWMDGDWLRPGEEGYAAQQALITDAYENGALVLAPGNWENGMAGPMALVLPDALGNISSLETYLAAGLIVQESGGSGQMRVETETGAASTPPAAQRSLQTPTAAAHMPGVAHP